jgi:hypothetical protein
MEEPGISVISAAIKPACAAFRGGDTHFLFACQFEQFFCLISQLFVEQHEVFS